MILESSKDHGTSTVLIHYTGENPTDAEVVEYMQGNYGDHAYVTLARCEPSMHKGFENPGSIWVKILSQQECRDTLAFLLSQFKSHSLDMSGKSSWWFQQRIIAGRLAHSPLEAIREAMEAEAIRK